MNKIRSIKKTALGKDVMQDSDMASEEPSIFNINPDVNYILQVILFLLILF